MELIKVNIIGFSFLFLLLFSGCHSADENKKTEVSNIVLIIGNSSVLTQFRSGHDFPYLSKAGVCPIVVNIKELYQTRSTNFSALSIGKICLNNSVGLDSSGVAQPNLIELASVKGLSTGLITSGSAVQALPASFIAHLNNRHQYESIALEFPNSPVDFFTGAGIRFFTERKDSINLLKQLENKGYSIFTDFEKVNISKKLAIFTDDRETDPDTAERVPFLHKSTGLALQTLSNNPFGFLLIIDGTNVSSASDKIETADFGRSIEKTFDFASQNPGTLIIITTDHFAATPAMEKSVEMTSDSIWNQHTTIPSDSAFIFTFGAFPGTLEEITERTGIFNSIVKLLHLDTF